MEKRQRKETTTKRNGTGGRNSNARTSGTGGTGYDAQGFYHNGGVSGINANIGQPRTGKTFEALRTVWRCTRLFIWDTAHNLNSGKPNSNHFPNAVVLRSIPELIAYWKRYRRGNFRIIFQPGFKHVQEFEAAMRLCLEVQNLVVFIDEISFYVNAGWMPEPLEYISRAGNHRGVALVYTTQRPQIVAMDLRDNTNVFKVFRLEGDDAIKALASRIPKDFLVQVPRLPNRAFVHRSADFVCRIVKN